MYVYAFDKVNLPLTHSCLHHKAWHIVQHWKQYKQFLNCIMVLPWNCCIQRSKAHTAIISLQTVSKCLSTLYSYSTEKSPVMITQFFRSLPRNSTNFKFTLTMWIPANLFCTLILAAFKLAFKISSGDTFKQEKQRLWSTFSPGLTVNGF